MVPRAARRARPPLAPQPAVQPTKMIEAGCDRCGHRCRGIPVRVHIGRFFRRRQVADRHDGVKSETDGLAGSYGNGANGIDQGPRGY